MKKIRILYVITKLELGGAQKRLLYAISHLKDSLEIWLTTQNEGILLSEAYSIPGIKIQLIPSLVRPLHPFKDIRAFFSLFRLIKKEKFDIVHTHSSKAGILGRWAARLAGVPVIVHTIHGFAFYSHQNWLSKKLYIYLERFTAKVTSRLIAVSQEIIHKGLRAGIGSSDQYQCIYHGIEREKFSPGIKNSFLVKKQLDIKGPVVGTISCFKPQKKLQDFLKAAALVKKKFPQTNFLVVGDGYLKPHFKKLSGKLGLDGSLVLTGWRDDIPDLLAAMDIFVLSSLWEGMPLSILEAMAAGLPVVATDVDGIREIVSDKETGFLVKPGDYKGFAQAIRILLEDENLRQKMGRGGQEFLYRGPFKPQKMIANINDLYRTLVSSLN